MTLTNAKNLSEFGQAALALDNDFAQLERLSGEIERMDIQTDNGLERAKVLLSHFGECGTRIGDGVQLMAKALEDARARAEKAAEIVGSRAVAIQARQQEMDRLLERFQSLGEMARKVTEAMALLQNPAGGELTNEQKSLLTKHLPELDSQLGILVGEARKLKEEARASQMKGLEKNADSMSQSLQAARSRLSAFIERPSPEQTH